MYNRVSRLLSRAISPSNSSTMQAIKGGCSRQTFALAAKSNDKVERKSGARLSKKERRVMVESFIKTYQKLNNGSFPSIHVTHKEVGGSYYIVREIVRDIIQENKVLAPPKVLQKDHKMFNSLPGDYPFGTISMEPQLSSTSLPNNVRESDHEGASSATEELILESEKLTDENLYDNLYIGPKAPAEKPEELVQEDLEVTESFVRGSDNSEKINLVETVEQEELSVGIFSTISEAVDVETFPLQASVKLTEPEYAINLNSISSESVPTQADLESVRTIIVAVDQNVGPSEQGDTTNEHVLNKISEKSSEILNSLSGKEAIGADVKGSERQKLIISHGGVSAGEVEHCQELSANEPTISSKTLALKNLNGKSSVSVTESNTKNATVATYEVFQSSKNGKDDPTVKTGEQDATKTKDEDVQGSTDHPRDRKPTLDRMNIESWEEISKKPAHEGNPFAGFVKACMTAFSKLWSK